MVKVLVNVLKAAAEIQLPILVQEEDLLEVLFYQCQDIYELVTSHPRDNVVRYRVVLVSEKQREFDVKLLEQLRLLASGGLHRHQLNLPVSQYPFYEQIQANQEVDDPIILLCGDYAP